MSRNASFQVLHRHRYRTNCTRLDHYLHMINKPVGIIKDPVMTKTLMDQGFVFDDKTMAQSQFEPSALFEALKAYDHTSAFNPDKGLMSQAFNRVSRSFSHLRDSLTACSVPEVLWHVVKKASAGAPYFQSKEEVLKDWKYDASKIGQDPCVAYYRTQSRRKDDGVFVPKVRLIWGYPLDTTVAEGRYARAAIEGVLRGGTPYVLGLVKSQLAARLSKFRWAPVVGSFDWSRFDSTVPAEIISMAFRIIKSWFKEVDEVEWEAIVKYFLFTPILMPDGRVYFGKRCGIPSGSYFTGLVGSISNLLLMEYLCAEQDQTIRHVYVMGDDSIVALNGHLDVQRMSTVAFGAFGMVLHPEKQRYTRYDHELTFLSHLWLQGRPVRPIEETVAKLVYSERGWGKQDPHDVRIERLCQHYGDNNLIWPVIAWEVYKLSRINRWGPKTNFVFAKSFMDKSKELHGGMTMTVPMCLLSYI